jgi:hypothetical protein
MAHHIPVSVSEDAVRARDGDDRAPVLRREVGEHIACKEGPFCNYGPVGPLHSLGVERQVVFH